MILDNGPEIRSRRTSGRLLLCGLLLVSPASAVTFVVNTTADDGDYALNGVCETAPGNGTCTLRAAFAEAEDSSDDDEILLPAGVFDLGSSLGGILADDGSLSISGAGANWTVLNGGAVSPSLASLIFQLNTLYLSGLTIEHFPGTAIRSIGPLYVADCSFVQNGFGGGSGYDGGSIHSEAPLTIVRTSFAYGYAARGGEIFHDRGAFSCTSCSFEAAYAEEYGGAVYLGDLQTFSRIEDSLFAANETGGLGGALHYYASGGGSSLQIVNSTFDSNFALSSGGAISALTTGLVILNSTITDNKADLNLDGYGTGGGVFSNPEGNLIYNSILSGNSASITIEPGGNHLAWPQDCAGAFLGNGYNIVRNVFTGCPGGDLSCCTFTGGAPSQADPQLGPLVYNGGATRTRAIAPGSPAIDGGRPDGCGNGGGGFLFDDQRGAVRPQFGCDLGAFEYGALIFSDDFEGRNWKWSVVTP